MITLELSRLLEDREKSVWWLHRQTGVRYQTLLRMNNQPVKKVDLDILEKICDALGCEPGDLLTKQ